MDFSNLNSLSLAQQVEALKGLVSKTSKDSQLASEIAEREIRALKRDVSNSSGYGPIDSSGNVALLDILNLLVKNISLPPPSTSAVPVPDVEQDDFTLEASAKSTERSLKIVTSSVKNTILNIKTGITIRSKEWEILIRELKTNVSNTNINSELVEFALDPANDGDIHLSVAKILYRLLTQQLMDPAFISTVPEHLLVPEKVHLLLQYLQTMNTGIQYAPAAAISGWKEIVDFRIGADEEITAAAKKS